MKCSGIRPFLATLWPHVLTLPPLSLSMTYSLKRLELGVHPPGCGDALEERVTAVNKPEVWPS